jgi:hypothetical protein
LAKKDHEGNGLDPNSRPAPEGRGGGKLVAIVIVFGVWVAVFTIIWLSGPISEAASNLTSSLSQLLNVTAPSVVVGVIISTYITVFILISLNPKFRKIFTKISFAILRREKSFHLNAGVGTVGSVFGSNFNARLDPEKAKEFQKKLEDKIAIIER